MGKQPPKKKITIEQAKELMRQSEEAKRFAAEQEQIGKAQIKNKVKPGSMRYGIEDLPVGQERIEIARKARMKASQDSLKAATSYPDYFKKHKK